jgi:hypothetical protein
MAQYNKNTHQYLNDSKSLFEVQLLATPDGVVVSNTNPLPVDIGNTSINISGNVNVTTVTNTNIFNSNAVAITNAAPLPVSVIQTTNNVIQFQLSPQLDAFNRLRVSTPVTLFDSFNRFADNGKFNYSNTSGGTYGFISNTSTVDLSLTTASGALVYRESKKVFAYQPGKSLLVLTTFVMNPAKSNLRQRAGYFGSNNGYFIERSDDVYFVERSSVTGSIVDTRKAQSQWNVDKLDGTGPSGITLNLDNPQILFIDMEWLGVGTVRMGFVIDGQIIHCHSFNHANANSSPKGAYIQTACLPIRQEIENTSGTANSSTLKAICSTVISEGGYELAGKPRTIGQNPLQSNSVSLAVAGTFYPVVSIRLHANALDGIAVPKQVDALPLSAANYKWKIVQDATINGAVWANAASDSIIQYNTNTAATMTGGTDLNAGFFTSTVQGGGSLNITDGIFKYQLERNTFTNTATTFTLALCSGTNTSNVAGQILWEEVT